MSRSVARETHDASPAPVSGGGYSKNQGLTYAHAPPYFSCSKGATPSGSGGRAGSVIRRNSHGPSGCAVNDSGGSLGEGTVISFTPSSLGSFSPGPMIWT